MPIICPTCTRINRDDAMVCSCGFTFIAGAEVATKPPTSRVGIIIVAAIASSLLTFAAIYAFESNRDAGRYASEPPRAPLVTAGPPGPMEREPRIGDSSVHPYDLLKNAFSSLNQLVILDVRAYPVLQDDILLNYQDFPGPPGLVEEMFRGVQFQKMLEAETALFEVRGYVNGNMSPVGQMAVVLPAGFSELRTDAMWVVKPVGLVDGKNGFGATVRIPEVRFIRYWDPSKES